MGAWEVSTTGEVLQSQVYGAADELRVQCVFGKDGIESDTLGEQVIEVDNSECTNFEKRVEFAQARLRLVGGEDRVVATFWMYAMAATVVVFTLMVVLCACCHQQHKYLLLSQHGKDY